MRFGTRSTPVTASGTARPGSHWQPEVVPVPRRGNFLGGNSALQVLVIFYVLPDTSHYPCSCKD